VAQRWLDVAAASSSDLSTLRLVQIGGSVLDRTVAERVPRVLGARLQQVFGMAEGLLNCTRLDDPDEVVLGTQGRPISPGDEVRVVGADGELVALGEVGELHTRGPYTPRAYFRSPEPTRHTPDGWYRTGDLVRWHGSGNLIVEGRSKDLVNRGGEKVSADEVEALARELLGVSGVAVVPVPDVTFGEAVCLVLETPEADLAAVRQAFLDRGVARFKIPERVRAIERLPLTPVGKVDKPALRRWLAEAT
jgi:non-ribosomal peptide synthetase component E (peptide arylation enzyme)